MVRQAWPYAVARGQSTGYQAIIVPDFLYDAGEAYLLEYSSRTEASPGELVVSAVPGSSTGPVTIVYRAVKPTADRYGIGDAAPLQDRSGRGIHVFEGLVLRQSVPGRRAGQSGITEADIDQVTARIAPAFRRLWEATDTIEAERSTAVPLGSRAPAAAALRPQVITGAQRVVRRGSRIAAGVSAVTVVAVLALVLSLALSLHGPSRSPAPQRCPADFPVPADLSAYPRGVQSDVTVCRLSGPSSQGHVGALIRNISDHAIQVTVSGDGAGTLRLMPGKQPDPATSIADAALTTTAATKILLLPPGESAKLTAGPTKKINPVFDTRSSYLEYITAKIAATYLIDHGMKPSDIQVAKNTKILLDIRDCAGSATKIKGKIIFDKAQIDAQFSALEKQVPSCAAIGNLLPKAPKHPPRGTSGKRG